MGGSKSSSNPVDMTPDAFKALQQPLANVIASLLGQPFGGSGQGQGQGTYWNQTPAQTTKPVAPGGQWQQTTRTHAQPNGPVYYQTGPDGKPMWSTLQDQTGGNRAIQEFGQQLRIPISGPDLGGPGGPGGPGMPGPFDPNDPNGVLRGIPQYGGKLVADITANEQALLAQLMNSGTVPQEVKDYLSGVISGQGGGYMGPGTGPNPLVLNNQTPSFGNIPGLERLNFNTLPGVDPGQIGGGFGTGENPFLNAMIESAQRPTLQGLEETLSRTLPGRFTQAGHFVQPQGSSAFDRAAAIATRGAADAMGDIATKISYQSYDDERNRQLQSEITEYQGRLQAGVAELEAALAQGQTEYAGQLQQQLAGLSAEMQKKQSEFDARAAMLEQNRNLQAQEQLQGRQFTHEAQTGAEDRKLAAAGLQSQISTQEFQNTLQNLQAQALPRMIEEFGIERGIEQFNNRMNSLMVLLQTAGGVSSPVIAQQSKSSSFQMSNPFAKSDLRLKTNVKPVGETVHGLGLYEYDIEGRHETGVLAQDVLGVLPQAVVNIAGTLYVNYLMLFGTEAL